MLWTFVANINWITRRILHWKSHWKFCLLLLSKNVNPLWPHWKCSALLISFVLSIFNVTLFFFSVWFSVSRSELCITPHQSNAWSFKRLTTPVTWFYDHGHYHENLSLGFLRVFHAQSIFFCVSCSIQAIQTKSQTSPCPHMCDDFFNLHLNFNLVKNK